MNDFAIVSESVETTVTKRRLRSPGIHFSPVDGLPIEVNGAPLMLDLQHTLAVLYTVFRVAANKKGY